MAYNRPQYNNNYPKKSYNNSSSDSNGGTARITSTKKSGCILEVNLNNQNLVLKGFWDNRINGWKLFPYYDKTKTNPAFNKPKQTQQPRDDMDDKLPSHMQDFQNSPAPEPTDFNPEQYEDNNNS
jgi:hypothetical protein